MKKVAIFIISLRGGGAERIVSYLLNEGYKEYEFHLILLQKEIEYLLPETNNIKIVELGGESGSKFMEVLKIPFLARKLKKYLVENRIETLLTLLNRPNLIGCIAKKNGWQGKLIISERADTIAYYRSVAFGSFMIHMVKSFYCFADEVTVISKGIANSLQTLGIKDCIVIYNPIYISTHPGKERSASKSFTFISIGRLEPQKNHALLLKAFAELKNHDCELVIVGKGILLDQLKELASNLKIEDRVNFAGYQSNVNSWLDDSDCFVFSSDFEGFGNVIIEALNSGVPVISTDCPFGPREILAPETDTNTLIKDQIEIASYGILTPTESVEHMAEAMRQMMTNTVIRNKYRKIGPKRAADFDIKKIAKQYFELF